MMGLNFVLLFFLLVASNKWQFYFPTMFSWALRHFLLVLMAEFSKTYIKLSSGPCNNSLGLHSCFQGGPIRRGEVGFFRKAAVVRTSNIKLSHGISIALTNYFDKKTSRLCRWGFWVSTEKNVQALHPLLDVVSSLTVCPVTILKYTNVTELIS